jgi:hypothetical protein
MAVVQISRIQHRRGNRSELPESLAEGEIGYAKDTGEIFMGAPNLDKVQFRKIGGARAEGIFPYSNIRLLTEFDVSYTMTDKIYTQGPLLRGVVESRKVFMGADTPYKVRNTDEVNTDAKQITLLGVIDSFQTGAIISDIRVAHNSAMIYDTTPLLKSGTAHIVGQDVVINYGENDLMGIYEGDRVWLTYFANVDFFEYVLEDTDVCIMDYSAVPGSLLPAQGNPNIRGVGTIHVIADAQGATVMNQNAELNSTKPNEINLYWNARVAPIENSSQHKVVITCSNALGQNMNVTFCGRRWQSNFQA